MPAKRRSKSPRKSHGKKKAMCSNRKSTSKLMKVSGKKALFSYKTKSGAKAKCHKTTSAQKHAARKNIRKAHRANKLSHKSKK